MGESVRYTVREVASNERQDLILLVGGNAATLAIVRVEKLDHVHRKIDGTILSDTLAIFEPRPNIGVVPTLPGEILDHRLQRWRSVLMSDPLAGDRVREGIRAEGTGEEVVLLAPNRLEDFLHRNWYFQLLSIHGENEIACPALSEEGLELFGCLDGNRLMRLRLECVRRARLQNGEDSEA